MATIFAPSLTHRETAETTPLSIAILYKLLQLHRELLDVPPTIRAARDELDSAAARGIVEVSLSRSTSVQAGCYARQLPHPTLCPLENQSRAPSLPLPGGRGQCLEERSYLGLERRLPKPQSQTEPWQA